MFTGINIQMIQLVYKTNIFNIFRYTQITFHNPFCRAILQMCGGGGVSSIYLFFFRGCAITEEMVQHYN